MSIQVTNLVKSYISEGKRVEALKGVSLDIPDRCIFTLLGPSGCGKTTLLRCIVGLETPDEGEIRINGDVAWSRSQGIYLPPEKRQLSMVFQTYAIWPHMTVFDNVAYPLQVRHEARDSIRGKVARILKLVQLDGLQARSAAHLSGGQQQRVALARALVAEPRVILFDEPLSNLDAKLREDTRKQLRSFLSGFDITAVYVTHDRVEALSLSDSIAVLHDGVIVEQGSPRDIYFHAHKRFVADFIGHANLTPATVAEQTAGTTVVDSALGRIVCDKRDGAVGTAVTLSIRPEFLAFRMDEALAVPADQNLIRGRLKALDFVGEVYEAELVSPGGGEFFVRLDPNVQVHEGDTLSFLAPSVHCLVLAD